MTTIITLLTLVLLQAAASFDSSEAVTVWTENEEASYIPSGHVNSIELFPIVYKCCPLGQRWQGGDCMTSPDLLVQKAPLDLRKMYSHVSSRNDADNSSLPFDVPVVFRLRVSMPNCSSSTKVIEKIIQKETLTRERMLNVSEVFRIHGDATNDTAATVAASVFLSTEGHLIWKDDFGLMNMHNFNDFCIDQINETAFVALICQPLCTTEQPCVPKCCRPGDVMDIDTWSCVNSRPEWSPYLYNHDTFAPSSPSASQAAHYMYGIPECDSYSFSLREDSTAKMYVLTNGSLMTVARGRTLVYPSNSFCVDGAVGFSQNESLPVYFSGSELDQVALICYPPERNATKQDWRYGVYAQCELVSAFFLLLTAFVYLSLWEFQNIHGWLQFAYVSSCFFSFTFLAVVQLYTNQINDIDQNLCEAMGAIIHFSFLAAFFWLTSMNFDLWWTFSGCRPLRPSNKTGDKKRFLIFAIFAWGFPGIVAGIGLALDFLYENDPSSGVIRPRFGERKCYFYGSAEQLPYFYGPVGVLLVVDLIFFINTVYSLQKIQKDTKFATRQSSKQDKKKFVFFMRIFILMGVLWIFEVISWIVEVYSDNEHLKNAFVPFDIINALQGLWIFIIFTCKPNTCSKLEGKVKKLSMFLESQRDQETLEVCNRRKTYCRSVANSVRIVTCAMLLPLVNAFRCILSVCARKSRSLENRRTRTNTITVTSGTFDKTRKFSDCSTTSTYTTTDPSSSYEMDAKSIRASSTSIKPM